MINYQITPEWQLHLDQPYSRRVEAGQLVLWTSGRTILAAVFNCRGKRKMLLAQLKAKAADSKLEIFESKSGQLQRFGYLQTEEVRDGHTRLALHAFTTTPSSCLQTAFYLDLASDLPWAIQAWEGITYTPTQELA